MLVFVSRGPKVEVSRLALRLGASGREQGPLGKGVLRVAREHELTTKDYESGWPATSNYIGEVILVLTVSHCALSLLSLCSLLSPCLASENHRESLTYQ